MGRRSTVRILEEAANHAASLMLCHEGDILPVQADAAFVHIKASGNRVEQRGLAGAVRADNGDKIRRFQVQGKTMERRLLIHRSRIKCLGNILNRKHTSVLPFWRQPSFFSGMLRTPSA